MLTFGPMKKAKSTSSLKEIKNRESRIKRPLAASRQPCRCLVGSLRGTYYGDKVYTVDSIIRIRTAAIHKVLLGIYVYLYLWPIHKQNHSSSCTLCICNNAIHVLSPTKKGTCNHQSIPCCTRAATAAALPARLPKTPPAVKPAPPG